MKRTFFERKTAAFLLSLMLIVLFSACGQSAGGAPATETPAAPSPDGEAGEGAGESIPFQVFYRGFTSVRYEDSGKFMDMLGFHIIETENAWQAFMSDCCPGIDYYLPVDFSRECLIADLSMGAKPKQAMSQEIQSILVTDGGLDIRYAEFDASTVVYALNTDEITHVFISIVLVAKGDLPSDSDAINSRIYSE